jgi:alkylation response protein AidB-like acyl-CoA dehydrogenase
MTADIDADQVAKIAVEVVAEHDPKQVPLPQFLGACFDAGLSWVHFPVGLGGLGASRGLQAVADDILQEAGGPVPLGLNPMGYGMAAPRLLPPHWTESTPALNAGAPNNSSNASSAVRCWPRAMIRR